MTRHKGDSVDRLLRQALYGTGETPDAQASDGEPGV
jgi:hypothetical protein